MTKNYELMIIAKTGLPQSLVRYLFGYMDNYDTNVLETLVESINTTKSENGCEMSISFVLFDKVHEIHMFRTNPYKVWNATLKVEDSYMAFSNDFFFQKHYGKDLYAMENGFDIYSMDSVTYLQGKSNDGKQIEHLDKNEARRRFAGVGIEPDEDTSLIFIGVDTLINDDKLSCLGGILGVIDNNYNYYETRGKSRI